MCQFKHGRVAFLCDMEELIFIGMFVIQYLLILINLENQSGV